jgi:hypothetical protein
VSVADDVLAVLVEAAKAGLPTPTNSQIATMVGAGKGAVKHAIAHTLARVLEITSHAGRRTIAINGLATSRTAASYFRGCAKTVAREARKERVVQHLRGLASSGAPMQANVAISAVISCAEQTIANDIYALQREGIISVESRAGRRRVVFLDTGEATGWTQAATRHCAVVARKGQDPVEAVIEERAASAAIAPCARNGCADFVVPGKAYCAVHEAAEVLEWPVVALDLTQEDLAA